MYIDNEFLVVPAGVYDIYEIKWHFATMKEAPVLVDVQKSYNLWHPNDIWFADTAERARFQNALTQVIESQGNSEMPPEITATETMNGKHKLYGLGLYTVHER